MAFVYGKTMWADDSAWLEYKNFTVVPHDWADSDGLPVAPRVGGFLRDAQSVGHKSEAYFRSRIELFPNVGEWQPGVSNWGVDYYASNLAIDLQWGASNRRGQPITLNIYRQNKRTHDQWNLPPWGPRAPQFDDFSPLDAGWGTPLVSVTRTIGAPGSYLSGSGNGGVIPLDAQVITDWYNRVGSSAIDGLIVAADFGYYDYYAEIKRMGFAYYVNSPAVAAPISSDYYYRLRRSM